MSVVGRVNQEIGHGRCGSLLIPFLINHFIELSSEGLLGLGDPTTSYPSIHVTRRHTGACSMTRR